MLSMGKSTISMVIFNSYVTNYQRVDAFPNGFHHWFSTSMYVDPRVILSEFILKVAGFRMSIQSNRAIWICYPWDHHHESALPIVYGLLKKKKQFAGLPPSFFVIYVIYH
jgi:hypothetical protein